LDSSRLIKLDFFLAAVGADILEVRLDGYRFPVDDLFQEEFNRAFSRLRAKSSFSNSLTITFPHCSEPQLPPILPSWDGDEDVLQRVSRLNLEFFIPTGVDIDFIAQLPCLEDLSLSPLRGSLEMKPITGRRFSALVRLRLEASGRLVCAILQTFPTDSMLRELVIKGGYFYDEDTIFPSSFYLQNLTLLEVDMAELVSPSVWDNLRTVIQRHRQLTALRIEGSYPVEGTEDQWVDAIKNCGNLTSLALCTHTDGG
jgi:hypothetical protein